MTAVAVIRYCGYYGLTAMIVRHIDINKRHTVVQRAKMGRIITVASGKGGSSKSTVVMILSGNLAAAGYRVAVIDADPNACYFQWHDLYEGPPIDCTCEIRHEEIVDHAQAKASEFDVVMIDT